jgi:hypothetical protein
MEVWPQSQASEFWQAGKASKAGEAQWGRISVWECWHVKVHGPDPTWHQHRSCALCNECIPHPCNGNVFTATEEY